MFRHYILDGHTPVPCDDLLAWAQWMSEAGLTNGCRVARTEIDGVVVSTVFLGLDHRFLGGSPPLLFESMAFGGVLDQEQDRYSTWIEAKVGHAAMCARVHLSLQHADAN